MKMLVIQKETNMTDEYVLMTKRKRALSINGIKYNKKTRFNIGRIVKNTTRIYD